MDTPADAQERTSDFHLDVLVSGFAEISNILARFIVSVLLARGLGAEGRGLYALALAAPGLILSFTNFGIGEATTVLLGKRRFPRERIVGSLNALMLLIGLAGCAVYFGLSPLMMKALKHSLSFELYAMAFLVFPLTLMWGGGASVALGFSMVRRLAWGRTLNNMLFLAAVAFLYRGGTEVKAVLAAFILASAAENLYLFLAVRREVGLGFCWDPGVIREQLSLGWHIFWGGLFLQVTKRLDVFLVNYFLGPGPLGIYVVAFSVAEFLLTVPSVYSRAVFSAAAVSSGRSGFSVSNAAVRQSLFLMLLMGAALALAMAPFVRAVYSEAFMAAVAPALMLLPGVIMLGFSMLMGNIFTGYAMPQEITKSALIACAATVALDIALIPAYGVNGAAAASSAAYAAGAAWMLVSYRRFCGAPLSEILLVRPEDIAEYRRRLGVMLARGR